MELVKRHILMRRVFSMIIAMVLLFSCSSCVWLAKINDSYEDYSSLKMDVATCIIVYNNEEYFSCGAAGSPMNMGGVTGYELCGEQITVAKTFSVSAYRGIVVSVEDVEQNVLAYDGGRVLYAVKKDFIFPDVEVDVLSGLYLENDQPNGKPIAVLENVQNPIHLSDFMDFERIYDSKEGFEESEAVYHGIWKFAENDYLIWNSVSISIIKGEYYCFHGSTPYGVLESGFYKIKPKYIELCKNAIEEFKKVGITTN